MNLLIQGFIYMLFYYHGIFKKADYLYLRVLTESYPEKLSKTFGHFLFHFISISMVRPNAAKITSSYGFMANHEIHHPNFLMIIIAWGACSQCGLPNSLPLDCLKSSKGPEFLFQQGL